MNYFEGSLCCLSLLYLCMLRVVHSKSKTQPPCCRADVQVIKQPGSAQSRTQTLLPAAIFSTGGGKKMSAGGRVWVRDQALPYLEPLLIHVRCPPTQHSFSHPTKTSATHWFWQESFCFLCLPAVCVSSVSHQGKHHSIQSMNLHITAVCNYVHS